MAIEKTVFKPDGQFFHSYTIYMDSKLAMSVLIKQHRSRLCLIIIHRKFDLHLYLPVYNILFPQKKIVSMFNAINIFHTIYFFKPTFNCSQRTFHLKKYIDDNMFRLLYGRI